MKICTSCSIDQGECNFYTLKNGKYSRSVCKACISVRNKTYQANRDKVKKRHYNKQYYEDNKELISNNKDRERSNAYRKQYYEANKTAIIEKERMRYQNDIRFRLSKIYRNRLHAFIKGEINAINYLDCNIEQLFEYLESQFCDGMTWENKGSYWEIDHILPVSKFDLTKKEHKQVCFHWCNLKPIQKSVNRTKSNKVWINIVENHSSYCNDYAKTKSLPYRDIYAFYHDNIQSFC
jgi:hypothetical protein